MVAQIISDTHGSAVHIEDADAYFLLGDNSGNWIFDLPRNKPVIAVLGNHDDPSMLNWYPWIRFLANGEVVHLPNGLRVLGLSGCVGQWDTAISYSQEEYAEKMQGAETADIIISHASPAGYPGEESAPDSHKGIRALTEYILRAQPQYVFFGHLHEQMPFPIKDTNCIGVYLAQIATI